MADRNPYIPGERRQDMENRETDNEEAANRRFAEKQAEIARNKDASNNPIPDSGSDKKQTLKN
jgi:guanylate kinase